MTTFFQKPGWQRKESNNSCSGGGWGGGGKRFRDEFGFVLKLGETCVHKHMMKRKNQERKKGEIRKETDHKVPKARRAGTSEPPIKELKFAFC